MEKNAPQLKNEFKNISGAADASGGREGSMPGVNCRCFLPTTLGERGTMISSKNFTILAQ